MPSQGLIIRPMGQMVAALNRFGQQLFTPPNDTIRGIEPDTWYSPLQPVQPIAPEGTEPRGFQYWAGQNLLWTPRADAEYTAADLKQLAAYPLARICIENVKDLVSDASWEIQLRGKPGETKKERNKRAQNDANLIKISKFFERPDRENSWPEWLRPLLDDMLVIDAGTILIRKTFKGEVVELPVIRGDSIVRYIDVNGFTPMPPQPAYAQNWWGIPLVNLTTDQLIYKPRNIVPRNTVASQLYGMSPTEQLATEIKIGMQRLQFVLNYYTEGSTPGVVQVVPKGTPPTKIQETMEWMNSELAGNLAARRQWRMVQGFQEEGKAEQIIFTKEPLLADAFDEMHIRKICFGYGTSPQRLMKMMNRASAQQADESADIEGLRPWVRWLKSVIDNIIQYKFNLPDYEITFDLSREPDPEKEANTVTTLSNKGVLTLNEARERIGEEPRSEPEADQLGVVTGQGFVPIGMAAVQAGSETDESGKTTVKEKPNGRNSAGAGSDEEGSDGDSKPAAKKTNGHGGLSKAHCDQHGQYDDACLECARQEIRRLEKAAPPASAVSGEVVRPTPRGAIGFVSSHWEPSVQTGVVGGFRFGYLEPDDLGKQLHHPHQRPPAVIHPSKLTPQSHIAQHAVERILHNAFRKMSDKLTHALHKAVAKAWKMKKAQDENIRTVVLRIVKSMAADWEQLPSELQDALVEAALSGVVEGSMQLGISGNDMLATINKVARDWASNRAAEMVGMRRLADGSLVQNPDARWAISDTTRTDIQSVVTRAFEMDAPTTAQLDQLIQQVGLFSDTRASMIARTEIARAQSVGNLTTWQQSGLVKTVEWVVSGDHDHDDECDEYEGNSPYAIDDVPDHPAHPNCDCILIAGEITEA